MDDECIHGLMPTTCAICEGTDQDNARNSGGSSGSPTELDTPAALERYRDRYQGDREATFEAYVEVFFRIETARNLPGG